jgi:hypothetical protein
MTDAATSKQAHVLLTDGILLAGASAFVYLTTFLYECGFCAHFGIPTTLIAPNLTTTLVAAAAIGGILLSSLNWLGFTTPFFEASKNPEFKPYAHLLILFGILAVAGILILEIYGASSVGFGIFAVLVAIFLIPLVIIPLLTNRRLPVRERFAKDAEVQAKDPFVLTRLFRTLGNEEVRRLTIASAGILLLAYMIGNGEAFRKSQFLVFQSEPNLVVLRNYGDLLVAARFDRNTHEVYPELELISLGERKRLSFRNEAVGQLSLANAPREIREEHEVK